MRAYAKNGAGFMKLTWVNVIANQVIGLKFSIPWFQVGMIVAVPLTFSMLTTLLAAGRALRIYSGRALRYE